MDETIHAAIAIHSDRIGRLEAMRRERDMLMMILEMDDSTRYWWLERLPGDARKLTEERLDAMREAARDKATKLLGISELERLVR